jgi:glycosyltransferase involved in cell wall biosynthesis
MCASSHHILILEPDPRGHTREWLDHLTRFAAEEQPDRRLTLAIPRSLADALDLSDRPNTTVQLLSSGEQRLCLHSRLAVSGLARWRTMRDHLKRSGADHGLFLCIDHLSLPLAMGFQALRPVSGILFRPSTHYGALHERGITLKERMRDARKRFLYRLMLRNRSLHSVLSLDPYFPGTMGSAKISPLGDPAFPPPGTVSGMSYGIPASRTTFALFGELTERKGLLALFDALEKLDSETAARIAVVVAGRIDPPLKDAVSARVARLAVSRPELWFRIDDRFLPMGELADLARRCDVVLAPYQRFVGSSGVMLWAASNGKPIITQDYGLLGKLAADYSLGQIVDTTDAAALAHTIAHAARSAPSALCDLSRMKQFVADRTPRRFAATIFNAIDDERSRLPASTPVAQAHTGHAAPPLITTKAGPHMP